MRRSTSADDCAGAGGGRKCTWALRSWARRASSTRVTTNATEHHVGDQLDRPEERPADHDREHQRAEGEGDEPDEGVTATLLGDGRHRQARASGAAHPQP